ncbi:MAG TPA: hypothetical protein VHH34_16090 [Pseudonocardiaceae bacterium]|nr:hypothetical protein [Pseudonocardiaceae bacterium]
MRQPASRLAGTWARITLALIAGVVMVMTVYGLHSVETKLAALVAVVLDVLAVRALCREWAWHNRGAWWRFW